MGLTADDNIARADAVIEDAAPKSISWTDRIDLINSAQTTEIWWKDLILKAMPPQRITDYWTPKIDPALIWHQAWKFEPANEKAGSGAEARSRQSELRLPNRALGAINQSFGGFVDGNFAESELIAKRTHHPGTIHEVKNVGSGNAAELAT